MSSNEIDPLGNAQSAKGTSTLTAYPKRSPDSNEKLQAPADPHANPKTGVRRIFNFAQMFFFALSYMSSWEAMASNVGLVFYNGGPRAFIWGFFIVIPGVLCQVASLAEMASIQPIAGAQYHWTWHLAPPKQQRFITWVQGWVTWFSWVSLLAGVTNIAANITTTLATTNHPDYVLKGWHTVLIMYAYLIVLGLVNNYAFWIIPHVEILAGLLHVFLWILYAAVLLALAPRHSADSFLLEKANASGWSSDFVSFNLGIILITWGFVGFDASAHIGEETRRARFTIPRTMFWAIATNALLAFGMAIIFVLSVGDIEEIMSASYPLMTICLNATNSVPAASALISGFQLTVVTATLGSVASVSRLTWAWARDGGLPAYFAYVSPKHRIPVRSVWLPVVLVMLLSLLNLASYTAFSVIISLSTLGLYQSYFIAIGCMLYSRLAGRVGEAPWSLGRFGVPINCFAMLYSAWLGVFMAFPSYLPVTADLMNYALPINVLIWIVALLLWFGWAKKNWAGLNVAVIDKVVADSDRSTKD